jgi:hypothetical protein
MSGRFSAPADTKWAATSMPCRKSTPSGHSKNATTLAGRFIRSGRRDQFLSVERGTPTCAAAARSDARCLRRSTVLWQAAASRRFQRVLSVLRGPVAVLCWPSMARLRCVLVNNNGTPSLFFLATPKLAAPALAGNYPSPSSLRSLALEHRHIVNKCPQYENARTTS